MPDGNGDRAWEDQMRLRMEALEKAHKELEDAFIVMTHVETRMSQLVKEQAEYAAHHEAKLRGHDDKLERVETLLAEMAKNVNFLIDREVRREGGPEVQ